MKVWNIKPSKFLRKSVSLESIDSGILCVLLKFIPSYISIPLSITEPAEGRSVRPIRFNSVDFPEPEGPEIAQKFPASMVKETLSTAFTATFSI